MLRNILDNIFVKKEFELNTSFVFHPSGILNCHRSQVFAAAGISPYTDTEKELMFCIANGGHAFIERMITLEGQAYCESEKTYHWPEYLISGTPDVIMSGPYIEESYKTDRVLLEIKTTAFVNNDFIPYPSYLAQANIYMAMTGIRLAEILTVSRVNGAYSLYTYEYDQSYVDRLLSDIDLICDNLERGDMPPATGDCETCWYMKYCMASDVHAVEDYAIELFNNSIIDNLSYQKRRAGK